MDSAATQRRSSRRWWRRGVICSSRIGVRNTPTVEVEYLAPSGAPMASDFNEREAAVGVLERDLDMAFRRAIATGLHATDRSAAVREAD